MRTRPTTLLLTLALLVGCGSHDTPSTGSGVDVQMRRGTDTITAATAPLGAGDVRIVSMDSALDLVLIGDTITSGLSQITLQKVRHDIDTSAVKGSGFGASIEKMVKGTVGSAMGTRTGFPLTAIHGARYENGRIAFLWNGKPQGMFTQANVNKKALLESFSPEESQRFVNAVNARAKPSPRP